MTISKKTAETALFLIQAQMKIFESIRGEGTIGEYKKDLYRAFTELTSLINSYDV